MAEQEEPVRRRVALKIIKLGMDTKQVIARFEAERQALAMMDHPNIAKVLDAGATETGRPYFVMELVQGHADHRVLRPATASHAAQRLELFVQVCQAVQHAHQKGIIHRDLKPSNMLVTHARRQAGAQGDRLRHRQGHRPAADRQDAVHQLRQMVGTPRVHEPRAGGDGSAGHRHALGCLLAGRAALRTADWQHTAGLTTAACQVGYAEMLRSIREIEPPKPSTRIGQSGEQLASFQSAARPNPASSAGLSWGISTAS